MNKKLRFLSMVAMSLSLAAGVFFAHPNAARAEKCNPKDTSSPCVGGPTGGTPTCGELWQACCRAPISGLYCTDNDTACADVDGKEQCIPVITFDKK